MTNIDESAPPPGGRARAPSLSQSGEAQTAIEKAKVRLGGIKAVADAAGISPETLRLVALGKTNLAFATAAKLDAVCETDTFTARLTNRSPRVSIYENAIGRAILETARREGVPVSVLMRRHKLNHNDLKRLTQPSAYVSLADDARRKASLAALLGVAVEALPSPSSDELKEDFPKGKSA